MALTIDIVADAPAWSGHDLSGLANRAGRATLARLDLLEDVEISLLATDDARIAALNEAHRGKARPTNVLSWPAQDLTPETPGDPPLQPQPDFPDEPLFLGDIAIAFETCAMEAQDGGKPLSAHVSHLLVHGVLHLLGYDHETEQDAALMEQLEVEILGTMGLPSPY